MPFRQTRGMPEVVIGAPGLATDLAVRLARTVGARGVVCLGCPAAGATAEGGERGLITLSRPPLDELCIDMGSLLLVVATNSRSPDLRACARARVPEVWLFEERTLTALSNPLAGLYRRRSMILPGERVDLAGLPGVSIVPLPG